MAAFSTTADRVATAAEAIRRRWSCSAQSAVILGTGLGELADEIGDSTTIDYSEIPGFPCSTALAHKGRLVCGKLNGVPVIMMQGRCHIYEGHALAALALPVQVLASLGIKTLIVTNAAGGLNPSYSSGEVMLIDDHINLMNAWGRHSCLPFEKDSSRSEWLARAPFYDRELAEIARATARRCDFVLHHGVYVSVTGPSYETRAEYRAFRRLGGDCVGMSTVPEALVAASCGLRVLGLSTVTNVACPDAPKKVTAEEVVEVAAVARPRIAAIIAAAVAASG